MPWPLVFSMTKSHYLVRCSQQGREGQHGPREGLHQGVKPVAREAEILHAFPNSKDPRRSLLVVLEPFAELGAVLDERDKSASAKQHADRLLQGGIRQPRTLHNPTGGVSSVPPDDLEVGQKGACLVSHAPPRMRRPANCSALSPSAPKYPALCWMRCCSSRSTCGWWDSLR